MSYKQALREAGAEVLEFAEFGSHQGDWWAKVCYKDEFGWNEGLKIVILRGTIL
jgi:hypothetical protein